eukprot:g5345.t1
MEDSSSPEPTQSTSLRKRKSRKNEEEEEELMKSPSKRVRTLLQKAIKTTTTVAGGSKAYRGYVEEASNIASDHGRMVIRTAMLCFKSSKSRPSKSILEAYIKGSNLVRKASKDMAPEEIALRLNALKHELSMRSIRSKKLNKSCKICKKSFKEDERLISCSRCDERRHENCIPPEERPKQGFISWHCEKCKLWSLPNKVKLKSSAKTFTDRNTLVVAEFL